MWSASDDRSRAAGKKIGGHAEIREHRKKGRDKGFPQLPVLSLLPVCTALSPVHSNACLLSPFLSLAALATLSSNSVLGEIKVKPQTTPGGKRQQLLHPSAAPTAGGSRKAGTRPASTGRALISNLITAFCQPLHTANSSAHLSQRRRGDGRNKRRSHLHLQGRMAGAGVLPPTTRGSLPAPAASPCRSHWPQLGCGSTVASVLAHTDPIYQTPLLERTDGCRMLFPLAVCPGPPVPIHVHSLTHTDGQTPTETRLPPPSCSGAYEDSQCLQHVMSHLSWACSLPLPTAHTSPQARLPLSLPLSLSHTHTNMHTIFSSCACA